MYKADIIDLVIWQALAGLGSCSLNVSLPVAACFNVRAVPLASAVLSSHGGYKNCSGDSCADLLDKARYQYQTLNLKPRALLVGYLPDIAAQQALINFKQAFPDCLLFLDPVLGDNGRIYSKLNYDLVKGMRELLPLADVIFPNLTEAALLLGLNSDELLTLSANKDVSTLLQTVETYMEELQQLGAAAVLLKGLRLKSSRHDIERTENDTERTAMDTASAANDTAPNARDTAPVANDTASNANNTAPTARNTTLVAMNTLSAPHNEAAAHAVDAAARQTEQIYNILRLATRDTLDITGKNTAYAAGNDTAGDLQTTSCQATHGLNSDMLLCAAPYVDFACAGSGDFFAAVFTCAYLQTGNWRKSLEQATQLSGRLMALTKDLCTKAAHAAAPANKVATYEAWRQRGIAIELLWRDLYDSCYNNIMETQSVNNYSET